MATDLVAWLRQQLDEDELVIERNSGRKGLTDDGVYPDYRTYDGEDLAAADDYLDRFNPKRMLADLDAKRRVLDEHAPRSVTGFDVDGWEHTEDMCAACVSADNWPCQTLRLLALPYAVRPGYREEWRP